MAKEGGGKTSRRFVIAAMPRNRVRNLSATEWNDTLPGIHSHARRMNANSLIASLPRIIARVWLLAAIARAFICPAPWREERNDGKRGSTYYTSNKFLNDGKRTDISVNPLFNNVLCDSIRLTNFTTANSRGIEQIFYFIVNGSSFWR